MIASHVRSFLSKVKRLLSTRNVFIFSKNFCCFQRRHKLWFIDHKYKASGCLIPKSGSTTLRRLFFFMLGAEDWNDPKMSEERVNKLAKNISNHNRQTETAAEIPPSYKLFTFVRDPLARIVSFYWSKIHKMEPYYYGRIIRKILRREDKVDAPKTVKEAKRLQLIPTFEGLVKFIIKYPHETDNHYAPMCELCQFCFYRYSFFGKLENFDKDFPRLIQFLGLNKTVSPVHSYFTLNATRRNVIEHFSHIKKRVILRLQRRYRADYEILKYPLPQTYLPQFR